MLGKPLPSKQASEISCWDTVMQHNTSEMSLYAASTPNPTAAPKSRSSLKETGYHGLPQRVTTVISQL